MISEALVFRARLGTDPDGSEWSRQVLASPQILYYTPPIRGKRSNTIGQSTLAVYYLVERFRVSVLLMQERCGWY